MKKFESIQELSKAIISELGKIKCRSTWDKGVNEYAEELANDLTNWDKVPQDNAELQDMLLNGASDWCSYSYSGLSLVYAEMIAERLATPSEIKRLRYKQGGMREPNARETWLDVQARALFQASQRVVKVFANL